MGNRVSCNKCKAPMKDNMSCRIHRIHKDTNICYDCGCNLSEYHGNCYHKTTKSHKKKYSIMSSCIRRNNSNQYILKDMSENIDNTKLKIKLNNHQPMKKNNSLDLLIDDTSELNESSTLDSSISTLNSSLNSSNNNLNNSSNNSSNNTSEETLVDNITKKKKYNVFQIKLKELDEEIEQFKKNKLLNSKDDMYVNYGSFEERDQQLFLIKNKTKLTYKTSL